MATEDGAFWVTYNGEIYNYLELREELERTGARFRSHSDTEVILEAYRVWGMSCVNRFRGMWSFLLLDIPGRQLFCSRDRFGIKPLYYWHDGKRTVMASEIKQILAFPFVKRTVDRQGAFEYLLHGSTDHRPETMFSGVHRVQPGENLILNLVSGQIEVARYYDPQPVIDTRITLADASRKFRDLFAESIKLHLRSDVEVGSCLSGGLDSSSIVCLVREQLNEARKQDLQRTFSSHFEEPEANELEYMQHVISATGVTAKFTYPRAEDLLTDLPRIIWHQDEPFGSTSIFAQWCVFKLANEFGVKVMLDGQGADEPLAGYVGFGAYYLQELLHKRRYADLARETFFYAIRQGKAGLPVLAAVPALRSLAALAPAYPQISWIDSDLAASCTAANSYLENMRLSPYGSDEILNNTLAQLTWRNNIPTLLRYEDRNSMAFSVEARVPYLDHQLVEFVMSLPSGFKIRNAFTKRVLREGMAGVLPDKIRWRVSKLGFATPERKWQQTKLRPMIEKALTSDLLRGYVDGARANQYLSELSATRLQDFTPWRWLNFVLWREVYDVQG